MDVIDNLTFYDSSVYNIHSKQLVFPYCKAGNASEWQLGVRIRAVLSFAVYVAINAP